VPEQPLIRDVQPTDREEWQDLWEQYLVFYKANLPEDTTNFLWRRIFDDDDPVSCVVAEVDGVVVGITTTSPSQTRGRRDRSATSRISSWTRPSAGPESAGA